MKPIQRILCPGASAAVPALLALLLAAPVNAVEIYKCKQADGTIAYSSDPCGEDTEQVERRTYDTPAPPQGTTWVEQAAQQREREASARVPTSTSRSYSPATTRTTKTKAKPARSEGRSLAETHSRLRGKLTPAQRRRLLRELSESD